MKDMKTFNVLGMKMLT